MLLDSWLNNVITGGITKEGLFRVKNIIKNNTFYNILSVQY